MTDTHEHNIVVVTGDVTMDWNLARTRRSDSGGAAWNADDCTRAYWQRGGAALLADLIQAVADELRQAGQADYSVREMEAPRDQALPGDPRFHHSYAMWSLFDYDQSISRDKNKPPKSWRVSEFLGLDRCASEEPPNAEWKLVRDDTPDAAIVVLDDANLGFRDDIELWPKALARQEHHPWILLKMAGPVAQGPLWDHLHKHYCDRLIVVTTADDLRLTGTQITGELSWERAVEDVGLELANSPQVNGLRDCAYVVVSFNTAGALLLSRAPDGTTDGRLFFDPSVVEGFWEWRYSGGMIGYTACLTGAIARQLMLSVEKPGMAAGIQGGLSAMRKLHLEGYGVRGQPAPAAQLSFPSAMIASDLAAQTSPFSVAEVRQSLMRVADRSAATRNAKGAAPWTILEDRYKENPGGVAEQIVVEGPEASLIGVPLAKIGNLLIVDRLEIESFRGIRSLISDYIGKERQRRPLSLAVFSTPGSGKIFSIIQIAESLRPGQFMALEFNLSQFNDTRDLLDALHRVRDAALSGSIPLVFWNEFDTSLDGRILGWLRQFLAPMRDGRFQQGEISRPIGRSIFVFAGGITEKMEFFGKGLSEHEYRDAKAPEFVSGLKGFVDILGPNPENDFSDQFFVFRRAILLRSILQRDAPQLFVRTGGKDVLSIERGVLRAFLQTHRYKHGARSMESVIAMSQLLGKYRFERSCLPAFAQLDLHVDAQDFQSLVQKIELEGELLEKLAEAAHQVFVENLSKEGYVLGPETDVARKTHSSLKPYAELPEDEKEQNRGNVRDIPTKLTRVGYSLVRAGPHNPPFKFPPKEVEMLSEIEHDRWMKAKIDAGWRWAPETVKELKLHKSLVPWDNLSDEDRARRYSPAELAAIGSEQLPEEEKEKDRLLVQAISAILAKAGYAIVRAAEPALQAASEPHRSAKPVSAFISYRRKTDADAARLIRSELHARHIKTFLDVDDLGAEYFDERLLHEIERAPNFIVLLSPTSLDRCIKNEDDWLRKEIAHAISKRRNIIPVLKDDFAFPTEKLPQDIAELPRYQGIVFSHTLFDATINKLVRFLKGLAPGDDQDRSSS